MARERLQKIIARSGLCSRRDAEELIRQGLVTVNGRAATLGMKVDPEVDHIKVEGRRLPPLEPLRYILLHKPRGIMTTCEDPEERTTVVDLLTGKVRERVYPVGRLDYHSEGLLILTNDGELAARVAHPRYGVVREYLVKVKGDLTPQEVARLRRGARIDGVPVRPRSVRREHRTRKAGNSWWTIEVTEGRTHEVRELFFRVGHPVQRLKRTAIGPIRDRELPPGAFRDLEPGEVEALRRAVRTPRRREGGARGRGRPGTGRPPARSPKRSPGRGGGSRSKG